jgi:hypothetical protein
MCGAAAVFDLGDHVLGSLFIASHDQYVSAAGRPRRWPSTCRSRSSSR